MQLNLSQEELEYLTAVLERAHEDLREEIYRTDDFNFKKELKGRETIIVSLLDKLSRREMAQRA
jgi:hypothetical protein